MKKLFTLLCVCLLFSFQAVYAEGQSQGGGSAPKPSFDPRTQGFVGNASSNMDSLFDDSDFTPEDEYYLGRAVAANIMNTYKPYIQNQGLTRYLNSICQTLVINSAQPVNYGGYCVIILDTQEFNAFASPGGHIFLTRGLVESAGSEDMLAAVIAHELAHVMKKHGIAIINSFEAQMIGQAADASRQGQALSRNNAANRLMLYRNSVTGLLDALTLSGYSQAQEFEADREAVALLVAAGYNPGALVEMLRVLQRVQNSQKGGFNTTHPTPAARLTQVEGTVAFTRVEDTSSYRTSRFKNK